MFRSPLQRASALALAAALIAAGCFGDPNPDRLVFDPGSPPREGLGRVYVYSAGSKEKLSTIHTVLMNEQPVGAVERTYAVGLASLHDATQTCTYLRLDVPAGDYIFDVHVGRLDHGAESTPLRDRRSMIRRMFGVLEPPARVTVDEGRSYYLHVQGIALGRVVRFQTPQDAQPWMQRCEAADISTTSELGFRPLPPGR